MFTSINTGYISSGSKLKKTTNLGINWSTILDCGSQGIERIKFFDDNLGFVFNRTKVFKTNNGGQNWFEYNLPDSMYNHYMLDSSTGFGSYLGRINSNYGKIYKTTNGGQNWIELGSDLNLHLVTDLLFFDSSEGIALGEKYLPLTRHIYKTTNGGLNWQAIQFSTNAKKMYLDNDILYLLDVNRLCKSSNQGETWKTIFVSDSIPVINSIDIINNHIFLCGYHYYLVSPPYYGIKYKIYISSDGGNIWNLSYNTGASNAINSINFINELTGFAGGSYLLKTTTGGTTFISTINTAVPDKHTLSQNYPNPFNPTTRIKFDVASNSKIKLVVYNTLGKEMTVLVNENMNAGSYETEWNAESFSSGIYYYSLFINNNLIDTKKTVLIK
ncbi:MAG TPA: T9SS type A sorting domain-containing protein [Ignavibacteria bacterium]|nr:T9SS type A sorting domain-containing protein [Ignavibacteria bacterium]